AAGATGQSARRITVGLRPGGDNVERRGACPGRRNVERTESDRVRRGARESTATQRRVAEVGWSVAGTNEAVGRDAVASQGGRLEETRRSAEATFPRGVGETRQTIQAMQRRVQERATWKRRRRNGELVGSVGETVGGGELFRMRQRRPRWR